MKRVEINYEEKWVFKDVIKVTDEEAEALKNGFMPERIFNIISCGKYAADDSWTCEEIK